MKAGDRIRATLGDSTIVGTVAETAGDGLSAVLQLDGGGTATVDLPWTLEVLPAPAAPATVPGTVVLDSGGIAWQADLTGGMTPALPSTVLPRYPSLDDLDVARGPLTLMEVAHA